MPTVFLSHSGRDKDVARRLALDIMMSNVGVWFDEWEIRVGHSITQKISRGLADADFVVVLLSTHSVESGWVEKEWAARIGGEASSKGVFVLPIMIEDCKVPMLLRDKKYADIRDDYLRGLKDLLHAIRFHAASDKPVTVGAQIQSGRIVFDRTVPDLPIFRGLINTIDGGCFERFQHELRVHVRIVSSHQALQDLQERTGIDRMVLVSSDDYVSVNPQKPSVFRGVQQFRFSKGEVVTNIASGACIHLPFPLSGSSTTTVECFAENGVIKGRFGQSIVYDPPAQLEKVQAFGTFKAKIAL